MVIKRAAILPHHPTPSPFAGERRRRQGIDTDAGLIESGHRVLVRNGEKIATRIWITSPAEFLAEHHGVARTVRDIAETDLAEVIQDARLHFRRGNVSGKGRLIGAIAEPTALIRSLIALTIPSAVC